MADDRAPVYSAPVRAIIYGLCHPETGELRYVGKTVYSLRKRLQQHLRDASKSSNHKSCWIRSLAKPPDAFVIEEVPGDGLEAESFWIAMLRGIGCRLVNHTAGGEGRTGDRHSEESRQKIAAAHRGKKRSIEQRRKMSEAGRGRPVSEVTRQKMRDALVGRKHGPAPRELVQLRIRSRQANRFFRLLSGSAQWHLSR